MSRSIRSIRSIRSTRPAVARSARLAAAGLAGALALAACSGGGDADDAATTPATTQDAAADEVATLEVRDPWAKAADQGMSAAFGTLHNPTDADVVVVAASSPSSTMVELHETVEVDGVMQMQQVEGFTVPAGGDVVLDPGGNHLMFMGLTAPLVPGDEVTVALELADGTTLDVVAPVKEFAGANETYAGGDDHDHDMGDMDGHDMGDAGEHTGSEG